MKTLRQKFHQEIVKKQKFHYFSAIRKDLQEFQHFQSLYHKILENNQNLGFLIECSGYVTFYKYIKDVIDQNLYVKIYQNEWYFLKNLNFILLLLESCIFPLEKIQFIFSGISQIVNNNEQKFNKSNIKDMFDIVEIVYQSKKYSQNGIKYILNFRIIDKLHEIIIKKQWNNFFFKIILFSKYLGHEKHQHINLESLANCLQVHILISQNIQELRTSYSLLADEFHRIYEQNQQLYEYGSIVNKALRDVFDENLLDSVCYFFIKAIQHQSILKLIIKMNCLTIFIKLINCILFEFKNQSIFAQQSTFQIFTKIVEFYSLQNDIMEIEHLEWINFINRIKEYEKSCHYQVKNSLNILLTILQKQDRLLKLCQIRENTFEI